MLSFADRVALVTGAGSGIGAATAALLAESGARVYSSDLKPPNASPCHAAVSLDVREEADWQRVTTRILEDVGCLDIVVHAAGISAASPLPETTLSEWRRVMATNLDGSFLAIKHAARAMGRRGGAIVVIGSAAGIRPSAGAAAYSTSKAALGMLVRAAAKELGEVGLPIRVNALSPAGVKTAMWRDVASFRDLVAAHGSEEAAFAAMEASGGGQFVEPVEVARVALFLASAAAAHITGVELPLDSGYTL